MSSNTRRTGRVLILGASGTIGTGLTKAMPPELEVIGTGLTRHQEVGLVQLDITDANAVRRCVDEHQPDAVVLCSAQSNVAACESNPVTSAAVNVEGVRHVARSCREKKLIFFSTDAVFSDARASWKEEDTVDPQTVYGGQKAAAEEIVREVRDHLILRTARVYSPVRGDGKFIDFVFRTLIDGGTIKAPINTPGNPTLVDDLCIATVNLLARDSRGTWHLAGPAVDSLYQTAVEVALALGLDPDLVSPMARDDGSDVPRISATLDNSKATAAGLHFRTLQEGLKLLKAQ